MRQIPLAAVTVIVIEHLATSRTPIATVPEGWSQQRCSMCGMTFAFSTLDEVSRITAGEMLREELDRHVQQQHVDVPSIWSAEGQFQQV